jgi:tetratricopeptide (TPR) repeat protein
MTHGILRCLPRSAAQWLRGAVTALALAALAACTPQASLLYSLLPDGTVPALLGNMQGMDTDNQKRVAELEARKDWDGLAKLAEENLIKDRNNADWWLVRGLAHSQAGRHQEAIESFNERVRLVPDETLGWSMLAQSYRDAKQPQRAVQALGNVNLMGKGTDATWFLLGESYSDLNRYLPAAGAYREAIQLNEEFARAWFGLGRAYARLGRPNEYEQVLKVLEKLNAALAKELADLRPAARN